ncbi:hypothetical protein FPZ43_12845 [Mucilaginibacter pallidiroseus]|uniref:Stationary phase survival protein SurE n=1 Tax=Mucilaginibacter pallidiroseus TaxID=2599295 RepID=A0A563U7N9_9SPHI|nr:hypothetical protein [Mucilaginibacter pallidiroseus]TWR27367.1 hypothetical protein FPZ43_12845 [Mucilaginibacter pallidiroseus]
MFNRDSVGLGLVAGAVLPVLSWFVFDYILQNDAIIMNKPGVPYLIAALLNLLLMRYLLKVDKDNTAKGVMMTTFAFMLVVFIFKIHF